MVRAGGRGWGERQTLCLTAVSAAGGYRGDGWHWTWLRALCMVDGTFPSNGLIIKKTGTIRATRIEKRNAAK